MPKVMHNDVPVRLRAPARLKREVERRARIAGVSAGKFIRQALEAAIAEPADELEPAEK